MERACGEPLLAGRMRGTGSFSCGVMLSGQGGGHVRVSVHLRLCIGSVHTGGSGGADRVPG